MKGESCRKIANTALEDTYSGMLQVKDEFDKVFEIEIECWCYGFEKFTGQVTPEVVHRIVHEMVPIFKAAIEHNYIFDLLKTVKRLRKSARCAVDEKELAFSVLVNLPAPFELDEDGQLVLAQIIDQAEQSYGGVLERMERRWIKARSKQGKQA